MSGQAAAAYSLVIHSTAAGSAGPAADLPRLYRKLAWRLMPIFCSCIMLNYLDRTTLAFASIQMTQQLQFSPEVLGLGGGLFFVSYCLMQLPSNLVCMRVGVTRWLASIMLAWGIVAALFAPVQHRWQFYLLRLLLGLTEAGTFPAVWYGISLHFPPSRASVPFALLNASVAVSQVVAAPVAAALLRLDGVAGLAGWQWVFLGEGLPCIAFALLLPCLLPGSPGKMRSSRWLSHAELQLLRADRELPDRKQLCSNDTSANSSSDTALPAHSTNAPDSALNEAPTVPLRASDSSSAAARADLPAAFHTHPAADTPVLDTQKPPAILDWQLLRWVVRTWQIWVLACSEAIKSMAVMALMLWLPVMVQSLLSGGDPTQLVSSQHSLAQHSSGDHGTGTLAVLLTAIPFTCAAVLTTSLGALAQRTGQPLVYYFTSNFFGGTAFALFPWVVHASRVAGFGMLTVALACGYASSPHPMAAITQIVAKKSAEPGVDPTDRLAGPPRHRTAPRDAQGTALALPLYNTVAMAGGFPGPWLLGIALERFGGFSAGAVAMGVCMLTAGMAVMMLWALHAPTAAAGRRACAEGSSSAIRTSGSGGCVELSQQRGMEASGVGVSSHVAGVCRRLSESGGRGKKTAAARLQLLKSSSGATTEQQQLLGRADAVAVDECLAHDAELPARRTGSSPRARLQRGKPASL